MAHIIDLGVRDSMKDLKASLGSVRTVILAIKSSTSAMKLFTVSKRFSSMKANKRLEQA